MTIEGKIKGKRERGRTKISFVKQPIFDSGLSSQTELKRLAGNKEEWREYDHHKIDYGKQKVLFSNYYYTNTLMRHFDV